MNIEMQFMETLESALRDVIEYSFCFDGTSGYSWMCDDKLFKTEKEAMIYALELDESFQKVKNLKLSDNVVPVYDDDGYLMYYLSEEQVK